MGDNSVERDQIDQMMNFIKNEAEEKANDINQKANEEAETDKARIIAREKPIIREMYRKQKQQAKQLKAVARSKEINEHRLALIQKRQERVQDVQHQSQEALEKAASNEDFVVQLLVEGLLMLLEDKVQVSCREKDLSVVKAACAKAPALYAQKIKDQTGQTKGVDLEAPVPDLDAGVLGGVVLSCQDRTITIDNTLKTRLALVMEQDKPAIKRNLFGQ